MERTPSPLRLPDTPELPAPIVSNIPEPPATEPPASEPPAPVVAADFGGAADDLLLRLFSDCGGFAVKSRADVLQLMSIPMQTRQDYIRQESQQRSN